MAVMTDGRDTDVAKDAFESAWRARFEEFASIRDDDAGIAGWSAAGLDARMRRFAGLWHSRDGAARWLDAGCGAGTYTRHLLAHDLAVTGVDYSLPAIRKARARSPAAIGYAVADVRRLPFASGSFDGILCFGVLQALTESESAVGELVRLLRPGGELWIDALNRRFLVNSARILGRKLRQRPAHLRYESPRLLERILIAHGLRPVTLHWMPIAPPRWPWLQHAVESRAARWMFRVAPPLALLGSHSFIIRGTKPMPEAAARAAR